MKSVRTKDGGRYEMKGIVGRFVDREERRGERLTGGKGAR